MAASLALGVRFTAAAAGTGAFTSVAAVTGYRDVSVLTSGKTYRYRAESASLTEWEWGTCVNTAGSLSRTVSFSSTGSTVSFTVAPQVSIIPFTDDILSFTDAMSLSTAEKQMAQSNILVARTRQVFLSGSGTYTTPTGCVRIRVRMGGGGSGGSGSGTSSTSGTAGGNTTFGAMTAPGGPAPSGLSGAPAATAPSGVLGNQIYAVQGAGGESAVFNLQLHGGSGGPSVLGGRGPGGALSSVGTAARPNTGAGGGGAGAQFAQPTSYGGGGGAAGSSIDTIISSPSATYAYGVGAGGGGGAASSLGFVGGAGADGYIFVEEEYGS